MYSCHYCDYTCCSLDLYKSHFLYHKLVPNFYYICPVCNLKFELRNSFNKHMNRNHVVCDQNQFQFQCKTCLELFNNRKIYISHLMNHLQNNSEIICNIGLCENKYSIKNSFASHIFRKHPDNEELSNQLDVSNTQNGFTETDTNINVLEAVDPISDSVSDLKQMAIFLLRLESKLLVPQSTINVILSNFLELTTKNSLDHKNKIVDKLHELGINSEEIKLVSEVFDDDIFNYCLGPQGPLRSTYLRKKFYTNEFDFVAPIKLLLGRDNNHTNCYAYYIPIIESLKLIMKNKTLLNTYRESTNINETEIPTFLQDITDGYVVKKIKSNVLLINSLNIILYQDAFEICNPLGSAKTTYKIFAMYFRLNIQSRSHIDPIQLVLLTLDKNIKKFSQDVIFGRLVYDLKILETIGVPIEGLETNVIGIVVCITGDNLGSHYLGGFSENFSKTKCFCRYCQINKDDFENNVLLKGEIRNIQNYNENVIEFQNSNDFTLSKGVRCSSIFNELSFFNVVLPGLPPCSAHDIFEGVGAYDVPLILNYFIKKKTFTAAYLNLKTATYLRQIGITPISYKYKSKKLSGSGIQNMFFILIIPLAIYDKMNQISDPKWVMIILLGQIINMVMANKISIDQTAYLDSLVEEYLEMRAVNFSNKLKPKHHYMLHYGELTRAFGPLINVWTFRFEQKHKYFKSVIRHSPNFINVLSSLTEKHQLLQTLISLGDLKTDEILSKCSDELNFDDIPLRLLTFLETNAYFSNNHQDYLFSVKITVNGHIFKNRDSVAFKIDENNILSCIEIKYILFKRPYINPIFIGFEEKYCYYQGVYKKVYSNKNKYVYNHYCNLLTEETLLKSQNLALLFYCSS